jgi:ribosome-associated translation inhibitor RaiA
MRLHIEGKGTTIVPHLLGRIAERLEQLNDPYEDIFEARVTLVHLGSWHEARVRLLLAGKTLYAVHPGESPDAAIGAALRRLEGALQERRALRRRLRTAGRAARVRRPPRPAARPARPAVHPIQEGTVAVFQQKHDVVA